MSDELKSIVIDLLKEVMQIHADPDDPNYNECDKPDEQCKWCSDAKAAIARLEAEP